MQNNRTCKNENLGKASVKNTVLNYLQNSNIKLNIRAEHITNTADLDHIRDRNYVICPRCVGVRSWILFFKEGSNYYAVNFPKHNQHRRETLQIHPIDIQVHPDMYLGTIMEGIYYRDNKARYLAIDEVYTLAGETQLLSNKTDRLDNLADYIKTRLEKNDHFYLFPCRYYTINTIGLTQLHEEIKAGPRIQEITFYPQIYGGKIYSYTIIDTDRTDDVVRMSEFYMRPTANPDVYKLTTVDTGEKVDIAYIPNVEISHQCKSWFAGKGRKKVKELRVLCEARAKTNLDYPSASPEKSKWVPIEIVTDTD